MPTRRLAAFLAVFAVLAAGCGGGSDNGEQSKLAAPFAYDPPRPIELRTRSKEDRPGGVEVSDVSFTGPYGDRLSAYLVKPNADGDHPAVVFAHGAGGNRTEMLERAIQLARRGVVGLTLDMSYSPSRAKPLPTQGVEAVRARVQIEVDAVREVRRSVDMLQSLPEVDDDQIGYVGWSAGARMGAIVAGVDHRIRAVDLIAGGATPLDEYLAQVPQELRGQVEPLLGKTDPLRYVGHATPSELLFQNGTDDEIVPREALDALAEAGSEPKEVKWYDSSHVPSERAWDDSRDWLADKLGLD